MESNGSKPWTELRDHTAFNEPPSGPRPAAAAATEDNYRAGHSRDLYAKNPVTCVLCGKRKFTVVHATHVLYDKQRNNANFYGRKKNTTQQRDCMQIHITLKTPKHLYGRHRLGVGKRPQ